MIAWELRTTRSRWKRAALWSATLFPLWTSVVVRNYAFTILLQRKGVLNTALVSTGIIDEPLGILYTDTAVILGMLYTMLPYAILPIYASLVNVDTTLVGAAESLGASRPRAIVGIVLPLIAPSVFAAAAITFVVSVGFYITPILLGGPEAPFLATFIDQQLFSLYDFPAAAATASILFLTAVLVVGFAWRVVGFEQLAAGAGVSAGRLLRLAGASPTRRCWSLVVVFMVAPTVIVILLSFSSDEFIRFPPSGWGFRQYATLASTDSGSRRWGDR